MRRPLIISALGASILGLMLGGCGQAPANSPLPETRPEPAITSPAAPQPASTPAPTAAPATPATAELRQEVSQYGITWTFDKPYPAGRFVTGDWWVVGPVTIVQVTPEPGPASAAEQASAAKSRYGATALKDDKRMRNGSMIITDARNSGGAKDVPDHGGQQGYDSRPLNYNPQLSVAFPCTLPVQRSLISTVSAAQFNDKGELATPSVLGEAGFFLAGKTSQVALISAAVLTCLDRVPPEGSFRPPYAGTTKPLYNVAQLRWDLLPKLKPTPATPDFARIARLFERPWLDHIHSWLIQHTMPGQNQPNYGREFARLTSLASLMLLVDVPPEQKRPLMIGYIQLGIDLSGLAQCGRQWFSDGGHWQGRKWPILFASLVLDQPQLRAFPTLSAGQAVYGRLLYQPAPGEAPTSTLFQEDLDSYYGLGGDGQRVLWQIVVHTGVRAPYEEKPRASFGKDEGFVDAYRANNAGSWAGAALAAHLLRAKAIWDHDAFFDFVDRWMTGDQAVFEPPKWYPKGCTRTVDPFVEEMWAAYRQQAPAQPGGGTPRKWVWNDDKRGGHWVDNPPVAP